MFDEALPFWFEGADLRATHPLGGTPPAAARTPAALPCTVHPVTSAVRNTTLTDHSA